MYLTPPASTTTTYFFGPRDEFHTEGQRRTDLAVNYVLSRSGGRRAMQLFAQAQVLNVFNQFQLCACGSTVFGTGSAANAGGVNLQRIDTTVLTPGTTSSRFAAFNPFTTTPVRGVNWDYGPMFGTAISRFAYTTPRTIQDVVWIEVLINCTGVRPHAASFVPDNRRKGEREQTLFSPLSPFLFIFCARRSVREPNSAQEGPTA